METRMETVVKEPRSEHVPRVSPEQVRRKFRDETLETQIEDSKFAKAVKYSKKEEWAALQKELDDGSDSGEERVTNFVPDEDLLFIAAAKRRMEEQRIRLNKLVKDGEWLDKIIEEKYGYKQP